MTTVKKYAVKSGKKVVAIYENEEAARQACPTYGDKCVVAELVEEVPEEEGTEDPTVSGDKT